ncbi:MAG: hypothetical protein DYG98_11345 [Haliscomenobacteraceae bacterium CHB4]|nr:hypothetical protein [Haliscomenobacteraceae bacterium CHB4]
MDEQTFRQFNTNRPALNLSALADELGIDRVNLTKSSRGYAKSHKQNAVNFIRSLKNRGFPGHSEKTAIKT